MTNRKPQHLRKPQTLPPQPPPKGHVAFIVPCFDGENVEIGYSYRQIHIHLTYKQALAMKRITRGLVENHAMLEPLPGYESRHVQTSNDAVKWLLEQVPESAFDQSAGAKH